MRRRAEILTFPAPRPNRKSRDSEEIEELLIEILRQLATVLVSVGYGISGVNRLTRRAYFEAARIHSARTPGKLSIAQIAAQTGLTRPEVSQLAREGSREAREMTVPLNRAQRVGIGWQSDSRFCMSSGKPHALPFSGKVRSFSVLAREYSGDIPARAMLLEMKRLKMIRTDRDGKLRLVRVGIPVPRQALATLRAMSPWISFLTSRVRRHLSATDQYQANLKFASVQQSRAAIRELIKRTRTFAKSVEEQGEKQTLSGGYELDVAIAIAASLSPPYKKPSHKR